MNALGRLANLGPTICRRLAEVGIKDRRTLARVGPVGAYVSMVHAAGRLLPVCYYLYSLEGALRGEDWRCLSEHDKERLRSEVGVLQGKRGRDSAREPTRSGRRRRSTV